MKKDYFDYNGKRYHSGDTIDILWYTNGYKNLRRHIGVFLDCDEEKDEYNFIVNGINYCYNKQRFYRMLYDKTAYLNKKNNKSIKDVTLKDEFNIDGLFIAWIWYIFIMGISIIFNIRVVIWIIASYIFFDYRKTKLKEAGYK